MNDCGKDWKLADVIFSSFLSLGYSRTDVSRVCQLFSIRGNSDSPWLSGSIFDRIWLVGSQTNVHRPGPEFSSQEASAQWTENKDFLNGFFLPCAMT